MSITRQISVQPQTVKDPMPTVSVVIPCYNYARYLPAAVNSALSQLGVSVNVIVVDDKSSDNSLAVARALAKRDSRVSVIAHEANGGPVQTFNDGLAQASGEYLVRLDADDMLTPGALFRAVQVMRSYPSVGLVYGHPLHFSAEPPPPSRTTPTRWTLWPGLEWLAARCRIGTNVITSPEVVMRRKVIDRVGGQKDLAHTHDMEMWLRIAAFSDVAYIHGVDQAWHRDHPNSLSATKVDTLKDLFERRACFDVLFSGIAGSLPQADSLHRMAMKAIATDAVELASRQYDREKADLELVDVYIEIADELVPNIERVRGWAGLQRRMAMGSRKSHRYPPFVAHRILRGLMGRYRRHRWHRTGV
jgi:glycosyltransferase involved in cell wall biosynthesis